MVTKAILLEHNQVQDFLKRIQNQLLTEENANEIEEEMMDHMMSMVEEFVEDGMSMEKAVVKMLKNMGDPFSIGYGFTDFNAMKKREWIRKGLKYSGIIILATLIFYWIYEDYRSGNNADFFATIVFSMIEIPLMYYSIIFVSQYKSEGHKNGLRRKRHLDISSSPLMVLWPAKKSIPVEYIALPLFFLPFFLIFGVAVVYDAIESQSMILLLVNVGLLTTGIFAFFFSEKFRIPKHVVVEDGILIKGKLLTWTAILDYRFSIDYGYKERPIRFSYQIANGVKGQFHVNPKQQAWFKHILKEKM